MKMGHLYIFSKNNKNLFTKDLLSYMIIIEIEIKAKSQ